MRKPWGILVLASLLAACGSASYTYTATGSWEGIAQNTRYPYDSIAVRFNLVDQNGLLRGSHHYLYEGQWVYVGEIRGQRSGQTASWRLDTPNGYILVDGQFNGERFEGTYALTVYNGTSLTAHLTMTRNAAQARNLRSSQAGELAHALEALQ